MDVLMMWHYLFIFGVNVERDPRNFRFGAFKRQILLKECCFIYIYIERERERERPFSSLKEPF